MVSPKYSRTEVLTIVMYHYVRPAPDRYGFCLNGPTPEQFEAQLGYVARHYNVCSLGDVVAAVNGGAGLPPRPCILTFDDGLSEHASEVWPRLRARGWSGTFFATSRPTLERRLLDVHKIHLLFAAGVTGDALKSALVAELAQADSSLPTVAELWKKYGVAGRYDSAEVNFVKRVLQRGLPRHVRTEITDRLFHRFVSGDETDLADSFYVTLAELQAMAADGMEIGGHGVTHEWLDDLEPRKQAAEVQATVSFLQHVHNGAKRKPWFFAYPYGGYTMATLGLLDAAGCAAALTVKTDLAMPGTSLLELPRLDANDLPWVANAGPVSWTQRAAAGVSVRAKPVPAGL
jgi:peptidoglycan/xylan/chitin deacetylase (PgdA/CDA1 family)